MIFYVGINLALAAVLSLVRVALSVAERRAVTVPFRHQLSISRALLCVTLMTTISAIWFVRHAGLSWSLGIAALEDAPPADGGRLEPLSDLSVAGLHFPGTGRLSSLPSLLLVALLAVALLEALRTILQYREVAAILRGSAMLRRHGRVVIGVSDRIGVPFSLRTLRARWVVLPSHLLASRQDVRFAVRHELQHHRQGDTSWAWISRALAIVFWPNPVVHLWRRWHDGVQELACDEALLERPGFEVEEYARCLLNVAERALAEHQAFGFAPSMAAPQGDRRATVTHLQKRIEMLFASSSRRLSRPLLATALAAATCCGVCVSALAAGLTPASRQSVVDAAAQDAADEAIASLAVERATASAEPACEHDEGSCPGSADDAMALTSSEPMMSSSNACTSADDFREPCEAYDTQPVPTEPDCSEPWLGRSVSSAE